MNACLLAVCLTTLSAAPIDTLVVCPDGFRAALEPWLAHRAAEGHRIKIVPGGQTAAQLRDEIRRQAAEGGLEYVVLVGDVPVADQQRDDPTRLGVPTCLVPAKVVARFGSEPTIASDNGYADLDDDALPDVAVGRLTADSPDELERIVAKILAYERSGDFGPWRRNVNLVAGMGGFGALVDGAIEAAARQIIMAGVPAAYSTHITYGNWRSPYCPNPLEFREAALESLSEGSLCWIYVGHASPGRLADLEVAGGRYASLSAADMAQIRSRHGAPVACLLACYTAAFDRSSDCLAEEMLRSPGGPVAVVGGSRVTMPYAMSVLGCELMEGMFAGRPATLGQMLLAAKRRTLIPPAKGSARQAVDALATLVNPVDPREELVEHLWLFNLLGDPLLRLDPLPTIKLTAPSEATSGTTIEVSATVPLAGQATLELVPRRDRVPGPAPRRTEFVPTRQMQAEFAETYRRANAPALACTSEQVAAGKVVLKLDVPQGASGPCECRLYVEGQDGCAAGASTLSIVRRRAKAETTARASSGGSAPASAGSPADLR